MCVFSFEENPGMSDQAVILLPGTHGQQKHEGGLCVWRLSSWRLRTVSSDDDTFGVLNKFD